MSSNKSFTFILIPWEESKPIQTIKLDYKETDSGGDQIPKHLKTMLDENTYEIDMTPLKRMSSIPSSTSSSSFANEEEKDRQCMELSGIYAYYCSNTDQNPIFANIRATSLSMSCGLLSQRFFGDVFISRLGFFKCPFGSNDYLQMMNRSISLDEIKYATYVSPDIRKGFITSLLQKKRDDGTGAGTSTDADNKNCSNNDSKEQEEIEEVQFPPWLVEAAKSNYQDAKAMSVLAKTMKNKSLDNDDDDDDEDNINVTSSNNRNDGQDGETKSSEKTQTSSRSVVVRTPLCLTCRRPCQNTCPDCEGVYFCEPPRQCKENGWSHQALCNTWCLYVKRRSELSTFPFTWHVQLMDRQCQLSDEPYESYLKNCLHVLPLSNNAAADDTNEDDPISWWRAEESGWKGGTSESAKQVRIFNRLSYKEGFALTNLENNDSGNNKKLHLIPPERSVTNEDCTKGNIRHDTQTNFVQLKSWNDYYTLRNISLQSPVALLCTFPLTLYYAIQEHGKVPITISKMLKRPMRIHVVGVEKELNFLDLFKEVGFLLPDDFKVEIVFICREDMVPKHCNDDLVSHERGMELNLTHNLTLFIQPGTFGDTLDPLFDIGTGPPDMVIGMNAGLYAYESWRSVIEFLDENSGVVGVFTDYNEHSGTNCASLGGGKSRESLKMNPFRQPRAMPVYSMNLPQFSNGFMYVFNEQELDM